MGVPAAAPQKTHPWVANSLPSHPRRLSTPGDDHPGPQVRDAPGAAASADCSAEPEPGPPDRPAAGPTPGLAPSPPGLAPASSRSPRTADHRTDRPAARPEDSSGGEGALCRRRRHKTGSGQTAACSEAPSTRPAAIFLRLLELTDHVAARRGRGRWWPRPRGRPAPGAGPGRGLGRAGGVSGRRPGRYMRGARKLSRPALPTPGL